VVALVTVVPAAALLAHRCAKRDVALAMSDLAGRGHFRALAQQKHRGPVTCLWAPFPASVPDYLSVSNRDPIEVVAARLGIKDIKTGNETFDRAFVVRSKQPALVGELLNAELRAAFRRHADVEFLTGAIDNLLGDDDFPDVRTDRNLRTLWMVRIGGNRDDAQCMTYLALGQGLAAQVQAVTDAGSFDPHDHRIARWEGR
jgi:hypothetical protein